MGPIHLLAALAAVTTATPLSARAPAAPRLVSAKFSGNGCPSSSSNAVSGSTSRLTLEMPAFSAELGGPDDPYSRTRNCNAMLSIAEGVPGFKLAVRRVEGGGAAFYGSGGVELVMHSTSYWQDSPEVVFARSETFSAPADRPSLQPVSFAHDFDDPKEVHASRCVGDDGDVGMLSLNLRAQLRGGGPGAVGAFIGSGGPVREVVEFAWVACEEEDVDFEMPEGETAGEDEE